MNSHSIEQLLTELYETDPSLRAKEGLLRPLLTELLEAKPDAVMDPGVRAALKSRLLAHGVHAHASVWSRWSARAFYPLAGAVVIALLLVAQQRRPTGPVALEGTRSEDVQTIAMAPAAAPQTEGIAMKSAPDSSFASSLQMKVSSTEFTDGGTVPSDYICNSNGSYPPLVFENIPAGAASLAVIMEDPDAFDDGYVYLVMYNIDPTVTETVWYELPRNAVSGTNDTGTAGYSPACPSSGLHTYIFTLYALDTSFAAKSSYTGAELREAMRGHILAQTAVSGTYNTPRMPKQ